MLEHVFTGFGKPEISTDPEGFDSWGSQGAIKAPPVCTACAPPPDWLRHSGLKSPWLYVEKSTPNSHLAYTDIGDARFVHTDGSCTVPSDHPAVIMNTPGAKLRVKLEDITNSVNAKILWDQTFQLRNTAPGGLGTKVVSYQKPMAGESENAAFIPFCFKNLRDLDLFDTKYRLTTESLVDKPDAAVKVFKDIAILRPRPLCDVPVRSGFL